MEGEKRRNQRGSARFDAQQHQLFPEFVVNLLSGSIQRRKRSTFGFTVKQSNAQKSQTLAKVTKETNERTLVEEGEFWLNHLKASGRQRTSGLEPLRGHPGRST